DRRMVRPFLVEVVKTVELRGEDPERQHRSGDAEFLQLTDVVEAVTSPSRERLREHQRCSECQNVSEEERAPDQPAATVTASDCLTLGYREFAPGTREPGYIQLTHWVGGGGRTVASPGKPDRLAAPFVVQSRW